MTQLADYADLRAEVVRLLKTPSITDNLDNYTRAAERLMGRRLRHRKQLKTQSLNFVAGKSALPSDLIEILNVYAPCGRTYVQAPLSVVTRSQPGGVCLSIGDQNGNYLLVDSTPISSRSSGYFAVDGEDIIVPGANGLVDLQYYAAIPTITGSLTDTNWCLLAYPELYTYATMACAAPGLVPPEALALIENMRDRYMNEARTDSHRAQYGAGVVRVGGIIA